MIAATATAVGDGRRMLRCDVTHEGAADLPAPLSPESADILARLEKHNQGHRFRTKEQSGELKPKISRHQQGELRRKRRQYNRATVQAVDPPPPPPPAEPAEVPGLVAQLSQDRRAAKRRAVAVACEQVQDASPKVEPRAEELHLLCDCPNTNGVSFDGFCQLRKSRTSRATAEVRRFEGLNGSVQVSGARLVSRALHQSCVEDHLQQPQNTIVKKDGMKGGVHAQLQHETEHPSSKNINYSICYQSGRDANGEPVSRLAQYTKQHAVHGAQTVRHMPLGLAKLANQVFSVLKAKGVLSQATLDQGGFNSAQVRVYEGIDKTDSHTDTRVKKDKNGEYPKVDQLPNTDVAILSYGDTMLLWRKPFNKSEKGDPWPSQEVVPLEDGTILVWKTGVNSDDWKYKHSVWWPVKGDIYGKGQRVDRRRRVAIVFRCTRQEMWFQTDFPHREVISPEAAAKHKETVKNAARRKRRRGF